MIPTFAELLLLNKVIEKPKTKRKFLGFKLNKKYYNECLKKLSKNK